MRYESGERCEGKRQGRSVAEGSRLVPGPQVLRVAHAPSLRACCMGSSSPGEPAVSGGGCGEFTLRSRQEAALREDGVERPGFSCGKGGQRQAGRTRGQAQHGHRGPNGIIHQAWSRTGRSRGPLVSRGGSLVLHGSGPRVMGRSTGGIPSVMQGRHQRGGRLRGRERATGAGRAACAARHGCHGCGTPRDVSAPGLVPRPSARRSSQHGR